MRSKLVLRTFAVFSLLAVVVSPQEQTTSANASSENWLTYGGNYAAWRYSDLAQINRANVKNLVPVWAFQTGVVDGGFSCTPIVADGTIFISTPGNRVFAINAIMGKELWHYYYQLPKTLGLIYGPVNRGVALGGGLIFMGTLDNHLVALNQKTGREVWDVDIEDMRQCGCNITGAPLVAKDKVLIGVTGGDSAHRGYIKAFFLNNGHRAWRFWTIPGPGEKGHESWTGASWKKGGGAVWLTGSYDPDQPHLLGHRQPPADFFGGNREGSNLFTDCVVALNADTGELQWYYQEIPHDVWDWDSAYECVLIDRVVDGQPRKLMIHPNKGGYAWVLDRTNGKFVSAWPFVDNANWIIGIDSTGALLGRKEPLPDKSELICPSVSGGRSWNHGAYSPRTGFFYTPGVEWCQTITSRKEDAAAGAPYFGGTFLFKPPTKGKLGSHLSAYDPLSGKLQSSYHSKYPLLASRLATPEI